MNKEYNEYCMKFSNEELKKYLCDKIFENAHVRIQCLSADEEEVDVTSNTKIETITFDEEENISIMFLGYQTSIFVHDVEVMFIDEDSKANCTSSDVYNNAVYEGNLRELSHEEMLQMFSEILSIFFDAKEVFMTQYDVPTNKYKEYNYYKPHMFIIEARNDHLIKKISTYENIIIKH